MRIRDAENEADQKVKSAEAEAQKILQDARRKAEKLIAEGKTASDATYQETVSTARQQAEEEGKKALTAGKRQATQTRKRFEDGVDGVVDRVVSLFEEKL